MNGNTWRLAMFAALLVGCGGGGGNSGGFTLSTHAMSFKASQYGAPPAQQAITATVTGSDAAYLGAGYVSGTQPSWLYLDVAIDSSARVLVGVTDTTLPPGVYRTTFQVGTLDAQGNILTTQDVSVEYQVVGQLSVAGGPYSGQFVYGDVATASVPLAVSGDGRTWTASSDSAWLQVPAGQRSGSDALPAQVDVTTLAPGTYQGNVSVTPTDGMVGGGTVGFSVTVTAPTLTVTPASLVLGGADGLSTAPLDLSLSIGTGANAYPYTVAVGTTSGGDWLRASATAGTVAAAGTTVQLDASRTALRAGTYTGAATVTVTVRDLTLSKVVPVTLNLEADRLVVGATGVGFTSSPGRSVLSRQVIVSSSSPRTLRWTASADQAWLTATASGSTGDAVVLTADPTGLAAGLHEATVSVTSPDATVENAESIRVGLTVLVATPGSLSVALAATHLAASPVEPLLFLTDGGPDVTVIDVNTGAVARTLTGVAAAGSTLAVSGDGRRLFVYDATNLRVNEVNATTGALVRRYAGPGSAGATGLLAFRPAGREVVMTPSGVAYDVATGNATSPSPLLSYVGASGFAPTGDGKWFAASSGGAYAVRSSALGGGSLTATYAFSGDAGGREGQACISADGSTLYTASGAPYYFPGTSVAAPHVETQRLAGDAYPNSVVCVWNGVVVGGIDGYYDASDIFVYDGPSGQSLGNLSSSSKTSYRSLLDRGLAVSADGTRIASLSAGVTDPKSSELRLQPLPAP